MNKITALKELSEIMASLIPQFSRELGHESTDLNTAVRFLDLHIPPNYPIMQSGEAVLRWCSVRSLLTTEVSPWFWKHISINTDTGMCTAWDESGANEINQYSQYKDAVLATLQYAESLTKNEE